jgi:dihydropyrimidinase
MSTTLIKNGTVINSTGSGAADVLVDGEIIAAVLNPGSTLLGVDLEQNVDAVVDATGKYVIPGGIDPHTHMELPFGGTQASDTFETGTRAAAWGGTTTIIDFAVQRYGGRVEDGLATWHTKAAGNACIDYGFHQIIGGVDEFSLKAMDALIDEGVTSFKLFMAYPGVFYSDDAQILKAMQKSAETGLLTMMHAENGPAIDVLAEQLYSAGKTSPYYHGIARAWQMEEEATHRAIMIASLTGAPLYVVHVSATYKGAPVRLATRASRSSVKHARNTSTYPLKINWARPVLKAPSGCVLRRCGRELKVIKTLCGRHCGPTTSKSFLPITARFV